MDNLNAFIDSSLVARICCADWGNREQAAGRGLYGGGLFIWALNQQ